MLNLTLNVEITHPPTEPKSSVPCNELKISFDDDICLQQMRADGHIPFKLFDDSYEPVDPGAPRPYEYVPTPPTPLASFSIPHKKSKSSIFDTFDDFSNSLELQVPSHNFSPEESFSLANLTLQSPMESELTENMSMNEKSQDLNLSLNTQEHFSLSFGSTKETDNIHMLNTIPEEDELYHSS